MNGIFEVNLLALYFLYGLSFYTMGLAIALQYRSYSSFRLAYSLSLLAAFGLFHGLSEWGSVFVPIQVPNLGLFPAWKLVAIQRLLQAISHFFLFLFGVKLISDTRGGKNGWYLLPVIALLAWMVQFARFIPLIETEDLMGWLLISESWSRYLLALPGGLFTAYGLALQIPYVRVINDRSVLRNLLGSVAAFVLFAVFSGLIVPRNVGWLGTHLNSGTFAGFTGFPVEVFRTIIAFTITWCITRMLTVFDLEKQRQLDQIHKQQAVLKERERFARDLHDDVIQAIYGVGINLQSATHLIKKDVSRAIEQIDLSFQRLNRVIHDLRTYIHDLESKNDSSLELMVQGIVEQTSRENELEVDFHIINTPPSSLDFEGQLPRWKTQIEQIVREALNNVVHHAGATRAQVVMETNRDWLKVEVIDNGRGIDDDTRSLDGLGAQVDNEDVLPLQHRGISNMRARAQILGGELELLSEPKKGTRVILRVPIDKTGEDDKSPS